MLNGWMKKMLSIGRLPIPDADHFPTLKFDLVNSKLIAYKFAECYKNGSGPVFRLM